MKVYCPHTRLAPETRAALDNSGYEWTAVDVSGSDTAYFSLLDRLWSTGETLTLVEHDIVISAEALDSLDACPREWCSCRYPYLAGTYAGLGCTRFRAGLIARHPDLMTIVASMSNDSHEPRHWCTLDAFMGSILMRRGERQCTDHPEVGHPSRSPAHGCVPGYLPRDQHCPAVR